MVKLEGKHNTSYRDHLGNTTIGVGFNMDDPGAMLVWVEVGVEELFGEVYRGETELSEESIMKLFKWSWELAKSNARFRCGQLGVSWYDASAFEKFLWADIAFNTGSCSGWTKVFKQKSDRKTLLEARRRQRELDSRVAKIGYHFGVIGSLDEAIELGLTEARYIK